MEMQKICPICGKTFVTTSKVARYCGDLCRTKGYRRKVKRNADRIEKEEGQRKLAEVEAAAEAKEHARNDRLQERAAAGDPLAVMLTTSKTEPAYWEAWKNYELQFADESGVESRAMVNGISIYSDNFGEEVVTAGLDCGMFRTDVRSVKRQG